MKILRITQELRTLIGKDEFICKLGLFIYSLSKYIVMVISTTSTPRDVLTQIVGEITLLWCFWTPSKSHTTHAGESIWTVIVSTKSQGPFQASNFTCTELNVNEDSFLFTFICIECCPCEVRRLKRVLYDSLFQFLNIWLLEESI